MKKLLLILLLATSASIIRAYDFQVGDLCYNFIYDQVNAVEVTSFEVNPIYGHNYTNLTNVNIPSSVMYQGTIYNVIRIGTNAFAYCTSLTSVTIPNNVTSIGGRAFYYCIGLTSVNIGNSVTNIGYQAFYDCNSLSTIVWNVVNYLQPISYGSGPFYATRAQITSFSFGDEVETIPNYLCYGMKNLTSITIPNNVTSIEDCAFHSCSGLSSITIPNSVTNIGAYTFLGCSSLTSMIVSEENTVYDSRNNCNAIIKTATNTLLFGCQSTTIPNNITSIGEAAFQNCTGLTSVTIPNSVTNIGQGAFSGCNRLTSIMCKATIPPTLGSGVFSSYDFPCYVPLASVVSYRNTNQWQNFGTNIQGYCIVSFQDWDGTELSNEIVIAGSSAVGPAEEPTREGYVFIGWDNDFDIITADLIVTAQYIAFYPITFLDWDGTVLFRDTIAQDSAATPPTTPTREGYEFIGWSKDISSIQGEWYIIALYEKVPDPVEGIIVTFKDGVNNTVIGNDTIVLSIPEAPVHSGYTFLSWMTTIGNPEDGITIKAIYQEDNPTNVQQESSTYQSDDSRKVIDNGYIYILRDGKTYTLQGQEVK